MRIVKSGGPKGGVGSGPVRRKAGFPAPPSPERIEETLAAAEVAPAGTGMDIAQSLLALDERRHAIEQGRASLDCLDQLRLDILDGTLREATAARLARLVDGSPEAMLDPELRQTVEEIRFQLRLQTARLARGGRRRDTR